MYSRFIVQRASYIQTAEFFIHCSIHLVSKPKMLIFRISLDDQNLKPRPFLENYNLFSVFGLTSEIKKIIFDKKVRISKYIAEDVNQLCVLKISLSLNL